MSRLVHNPSDQDLFCDAAGTIVPARGQVEVSDEAAALVPDTVFEVSDVLAEAAPAAEATAEPAPAAALADPTPEAAPAATEGA